MVALPTDKNDGRRPGKPHKMETFSGDGTIVVMFGIKSLRNGLAKKTG